MTFEATSVRRRAMAIAILAMLALLILVVVPATALDATTSYTGCLKATGSLVNIAVGDTPLKSCGPSPVVHFSGGDMTSVATPATGGLTGGVTLGDATLSLQDSFKLPQACSTGQVTKWNGTTWGCGNDNDTTYSAGSGLTLSGTTFTADTSVVQARVTGACSNGDAIREVNGDGTVACQSPTQAQAPNLQRIALLKWFGANRAASFSVGSTPLGVAFDGADIWVTSEGSGTVTKLRASDGANLGTFSVGGMAFGVAFDGADIWVANETGNSVTELRASDGASLGTFSVGATPGGVAFDGADIWVTNQGGNTVTELRASDGVSLGTFSVGSSPRGVAFDGADIWVTNQDSNTVTELRASDGAILGTFSAGSNPFGVAFDGANLWVTDNGSGSVTKL